MAEEIENEVTTGGFNLENFIEEKKKPLMIGGGILAVVLIAVIYIFGKWMPDRELKAQNDIYMAQFAFDKDSFNIALNGGKTSEGKPFKGFLAVANDYGMTHTAKLANLYAGICYLNLKKYQEAVTYLDKGNVSDPVLGAIRLNDMGDAYSEMGKMDDAIGYYEKAAAYSDNEKFAPLFLLKAGMAYEKQKKLADAKKTYEKIRDQYPNSDEGRDIEKYIIRVSAGS